jgi:hypothetical protein
LAAFLSAGIMEAPVACTSDAGALPDVPLDAASVSPHDAGDGGNAGDAGGEGDAADARDAPVSPPGDATGPDGSLADASAIEAAPFVPDPCIEAGSCTPGVWTNVTPPSVAANLNADLSCGNYGTETVQGDPAHPEDLYTLFMCQGVWKSSDYGLSWQHVNTGQNGSTLDDCAGDMKIAPHAAGTPATLYVSCIRGAGWPGFWVSTNGGVDWSVTQVTAGGSSVGYYAPAVDPYDANHLLMAGHGVDVLLQSSDGGQTWSSVPLAAGMIDNSGATYGVYFIDTGDARTTRNTWLVCVPAMPGTWRTENGGGTSGEGWTQVETNEKGSGITQIYQPDNTSGVVYMAGDYSANGNGVFRSTDYGKTWTHVGLGMPEKFVFGTSRNVYSMYGWAIGSGGMTGPSLEIAPQPGLSWTAAATPAEMTQGPTQAAVTSDGTYNIVVTANYNAGLWRYVEPTQ